LPSNTSSALATSLSDKPWLWVGLGFVVLLMMKRGKAR
jgi:hypothetical protein